MSTEYFSETETDKTINFNDSAAFSGALDTLGMCGAHTVIHTPTTDSEAIFTNTVRECRINVVGVDIIGSGHGIAGFDLLGLYGDGNISQSFGHEVKLYKPNTGAAGQIVLYKPAIDAIEGTIDNLAILKNDIDLDGINGTVNNPEFLCNTQPEFAIRTAGIIEGATGNQVPTARTGITDERYYFPQGWGSSATAAFAANLLAVAPPIHIPERTEFNRIGIEVTVGGTSSTGRLGVYKMENGVPTELVCDAGTVNTDTTGEKELSGSFATFDKGGDPVTTDTFTLEAGAYFLAYQAEGTVATVRSLAFTDAELIGFYGNSSGDPTAAVVEDYLYTTNVGALPTTFGAVSRLKISAVPAVWIRKV